MQNSMNVSDSRLIRKRLYRLNDSKQFEGFDSFLIRKILPEKAKAVLESKPVSEELLQILREEAYDIFWGKIKQEKVATRVTIKKWFGLNGYVRPKRKQIIKLAFALQLTEEELQEYLCCGILQPGIQINDYREMIYLYGVLNGISYDECQDMIRIFEAQVYKDTVLQQNTHTMQLWNMFRLNCNKSKEEFLSWMCKNAGFFKGYSKVALRHFMEIKSEMLHYIRASAREQLFWLLEETDFFDWAAQNDVPKEEYGENISRYIKNVSRRKDKGMLTDELKEAIQELNWVAHFSHDKTADLLAELYASALEPTAGKVFSSKRNHYKKRENFKLPKQISFMTDKHISQIVGVAQQKEKEIRLSQALGSLECEETNQKECPAWIAKLLSEYGFVAPETIQETKELLRNILKMQEQRCHLVQREDLLPLIHYVAQRRYEQVLQEQKTGYQCEEARIFFIQMADAIFEECQMAPVSEEYQLDYLLLSCYGADYMYSLSDVIEESELMQ